MQSNKKNQNRAIFFISAALIGELLIDSLSVRLLFDPDFLSGVPIYNPLPQSMAWDGFRWTQISELNFPRVPNTAAAAAWMMVPSTAIGAGITAANTGYGRNNRLNFYGWLGYVTVLPLAVATILTMGYLTAINDPSAHAFVPEDKVATGVLPALTSTTALTGLLYTGFGLAREIKKHMDEKKRLRTVQALGM